MENPSGIGEIRYVFGDGVPDMDNSILYQGPFHLKGTQTLKAGIFQSGILLSTLDDANFRLVPKSKEDPVRFQVFYGEDMDKLPNFSTEPVREGHVTEFSALSVLGEDGRQEQVALLMESQLDIQKAGTYVFYTNSDDGSKLYVNENLVVDNDGDHGVRERSGSIELPKGLHHIRVAHFNGGGGYHLDVKYKGEGIPKQILPANLLHRNE